MKKYAFITAALAVALAVLIPACNVAYPFGAKSTGSVTLSVNNTVAKSFMPPISMECAEYLVSAVGPAPYVVEPQVITAGKTFPNLVPGSWTFTVVGRNAAHDPIGGGTGAATVVIGETASLSIVVAEYTGPGSFRMNISWEPDIVAFPVWTGQMRAFDNSTTPMPFVTNAVACTTVSDVPNLAAGYYTMIVRLYDDPSGTMNGTEILSTGAATVVRVARGYQTVGSYNLHAVQSFGSINIDISLDMHDPLVLTPNIPFGDVQMSAGLTRTFTVAADVASTTVFYLNGQQVGIDSYDLDSDDLRANESYRLDAVAYSIDGSRANSGTWLVSNNAYTAEQVRISGSSPGAVGLPGTSNIQYTLRSAQSPDAVIATLTVPAHSPAEFSFEAVIPGQYVLKMESDSYGTIWGWWRAGATDFWQTAPDAQCVITVPHAATSYTFQGAF